ncbi:adenylyl-sulfate kinase [Paraburkholderia sp. RL17-383-BIF-A]|uniref:adenylyl-sulfate kinase n=1 Tax=Paraburkholderia sp. RL17-383-BIF-A TaxID=3031631 RepID=UPI0038B8D8C7
MTASFSHGCTFRLNGRSGSGKSTIGRALLTSLRERNIYAVVLEGDELRTGLNSNLGYNAADRTDNLRRIEHVANLFLQQGFVTIIVTISPEQKHRDVSRQILRRRFIEVFVDISLKIFEARDARGSYKRARSGDIPGFTGVAASMKYC